MHMHLTDTIDSTALLPEHGLSSGADFSPGVAVDLAGRKPEKNNCIVKAYVGGKLQIRACCP